MAQKAYLNNTKITPATWDKKYPLSDLPTGKLWDGVYAGGFQCVGFARMVLAATYGVGPALTLSKFDNALAVKTAFADIENGARVTFRWQPSVAAGQHAIIIADKMPTGITVYDCNYLNDRLIRYRNWSWSHIFAKFSGIIGGFNPLA